MSLLLVPDLGPIVLDSCKALIDQYHFTVHVKERNVIYLYSQHCGIKIVAGISPVGERQIDIYFFDPNSGSQAPKYYSDVFLLFLKTRSEPRDILDRCGGEKATFEETLREVLRCFTAHTIKYRKDILDGDFTSWVPAN